MRDLQMDRIARLLWAIADDPGPLVSRGKVMRKDEDGTPYPDQELRLVALQQLRKLLAARRKLWGLDAPRRRANTLAAMTVAEIQRHLDNLRAELGLQPDGGAPSDGKSPPVPEDGGE
jgi:hypothetical protein